MKLACPKCKALYDLPGLIPERSKTATVVCSKCNNQMEVTPGKLLGWFWPKVSARKGVRQR